MAIKPLSVGQKKVIAALARAVFYAEVEANVKDFGGYKKHMMTSDRAAKQAEREFQKAVKTARDQMLVAMEKPHGA